MWKDYDKDKEGLFLWKACEPYVRKMRLGWKQKGIVDHPLEYGIHYDSKLDVVRRVLLKKKCVCDIEKRGWESRSKLYFNYCNGKWLMDFNVFLLMFGSN